MHDEPLINPSCTMRSGKVLWFNPNPPNNLLGVVVDSEQKGNLLIRDLWYQGKGCILHMHVVNTYAAYYLQKTPENSL